MDWLNAVFGTQHDLTAARECARAVLIFVYGLVALRVFGRRMFGKWAALDIVVSIVVGSNLSRALTGQAALWGTLLATTVMLGIYWLVAHLAARSSTVSRLVEGRPVVLAEDGKALTGALRRHAVSEADLAESLRGSGLGGVDESREVVLEPSGKINSLKAE